MTLTSGPDAGWYPDPAGDRAWRWWDGATWTDHLRARETDPVPAAPEPVAAQPAAEPAPAPAGIPQPGEVAPPPMAAVAGNVSTTPPIPLTDQLYWHSSAAEVVEVPRVGGSRQPTPGVAASVPSYVRDWNDLGSPHTPGIWLLALSPILGIGMFLAVGTAMSMAGLPPIVPLAAGLAAAGLLQWLFAALDTRALAARGYHAPRLAWMLLFPPLAYFIARGKAVRRESKAAWAPELVYILSLLAVTGGAVVMSALLIAALSSMGLI